MGGAGVVKRAKKPSAVSYQRSASGDQRSAISVSAMSKEAVKAQGIGITIKENAIGVQAFLAC
jgi:hypothetical protein